MSAKVSELFDVFLSLRQIRPGTAKIYGWAFGHLLDIVGDRPADAYGPIDAQTFAARLRDVIGPRTVNMYLRCVKTFFGWLVESKVLAESPFDTVRPLRVPPSAKGKTPYEDGDLAKLLRHCPGDRWRLILALAMTTGLRRGEILNLTIAEIDHYHGTICTQDKPESAFTWAWQVKDYETRTVPLTAAVMDLLVKVEAELPDGQPYVCLSPRRYRRLMELKASGKLTYEILKCPENNFTRTVKQICASAGVRYNTFHALRGTALSIMGEHGLQPHELQRIAGHASVQTTYKHYVRPRQQFLERAREATFQVSDWAV